MDGKKSPFQDLYRGEETDTASGLEPLIGKFVGMIVHQFQEGLNLVEAWALSHRIRFLIPLDEPCIFQFRQVGMRHLDLERFQVFIFKLDVSWNLWVIVILWIMF
ncbi:hypothetical protein A4G99_12285 [Haladaptatus sp. R4]|uniref:hypothetical protein n=1 Tax=Haladaptatus sp. R4 TaxID=1679489 RepID=UPI0007B46205|nr:hypothetical protein [Haladaptatus sp. R4]KZN23657.1 hypothetical protein A4G99_12285 [Haladaptatus sp. R4]